MVAKTIPSIYMETMEETYNKEYKLKEARNARGVRTYVGKYKTRLLASSGKPYTQQSNNKGKTRKGRLL